MAGLLDKIKGVFGKKSGGGSADVKQTAGEVKDKVDDLVEKHDDKIPDKVEEAYDKISDQAEKIIPGNE